MTDWKQRVATNLPRTAVVLHDLAMVWVAWSGLHLVRYALRSEPSPMDACSAEIEPVLLAQGVVFWRVGLYRGVCRFASVPHLINIRKAYLFCLVGIYFGRFRSRRIASGWSLWVGRS